MLALFLANIKMLLRNRQALFWSLVFPLIFVTVFGLFDLGSIGSTKIAIVDKANTPLSEQLIQNLQSIDFLKVDQTLAEEAPARQALEAGRIDFVLVFPAELQGLAPGTISSSGPVVLTFLYDEANFRTNQLVSGVLSQFLDEANLQIAGASHFLSLRGEGLRTKQTGYFDFVVPGILGMGVMVFSITFISTNIAQYREQKILKRMLATPLKVYKFFLAQVTAHLLLSIVQAAIILAVAVLVFGARIYGSYLWLLVLIVLSNIVFLNLGFIVGGLSKNVNAANGLSNVVSLPMMFFSGTFFPTDSLPSIVRTVVQYLPLTPLLDALRKVALDAQPIWATESEMALLGTWIIATSVLVVRFFKFA